MSAVLYLIRHGATEGDGVVRYKGVIDVEISGLGKAQACAAGERLKGLVDKQGRRLDAVYTSPLKRALSTAEEISRLFELLYHIPETLVFHHEPRSRV